MHLSRAARIRKTAHTRAAVAAARGEGSSASLPSTAWHGGPMCFAIALTLSKNVILAEVFLIIIKSRYLARLNTF